MLFVTALQLILSRVESDRGDSIPDKMTLAKVLHHFCDWTMWAYGKCLFCLSVSISHCNTSALMFMNATMPAYAIGTIQSNPGNNNFLYLCLGYFITIILRSMGWGIRDSFLLSAPPYVFAVGSFPPHFCFPFF